MEVHFFIYLELEMHHVLKLIVKISLDQESIAYFIQLQYFIKEQWTSAKYRDKAS